ncbi:MAG: response regulator [Nostoc sp.]|uniref:response regulator transcription factor n=1 Tax=Nostoc sp. TaxID=1180 RepID=UPI002FF49FFB
MMHKSLKTILLIEDEVDCRNLFSDVLEAKGFDTICAENGTAGIGQVQKYLPDLVICDIQMPDIDGYSVLSTLSQDPATAVIPFIFLTGSSYQADVRKGMELGADDYLTKPCTIENLLRAIAIRLEKQAFLKFCYTNNLDQRSEPLSTSASSESIFPSIPKLQKVFEYIEANYRCQGITLSKVADAVGYSSAYLTNQVAKKTGETVNAWIVKRRMAAARLLLKDTDETIDQIATALGYENTSYFYRQFRQHHRLSPKIWRKKH